MHVYVYTCHHIPQHSFTHTPNLTIVKGGQGGRLLRDLSRQFTRGGDHKHVYRGALGVDRWWQESKASYQCTQ